MNYTCYSSFLICIFDIFRSWKTPLMNPLSKHQLLQDDGAIPTQVETSTATQAEAVVAAVLPSIPPCKVSMTVLVSGTCSGRKKSVVWGHFEKNKDR